MTNLPENPTYGQALGPAMTMTTQEDADAWLEVLVQRCMTQTGKSREEATAIQRSNLGYYAGYYSDETRERVERLFRCKHPIFGSIAEKGPPTFKQAFGHGVKMGEARKR